MTARKVIVATTSRLRHSMRRSLAAMRRAWRDETGRVGALVVGLGGGRLRHAIAC